MNIRSTFTHLRQQLKASGSAFIWLLCISSSNVLAADSTPLMSSRIYHHLAHMQPDFDAKRFASVRQQLQKLLPTTRNGNPYDRAVLLQLLGQAQMQLKQTEQASSAYEQALALNILPQADALSIERELARLYIAQSRHEDAINILENLREPNRDSRLLLAQSYLQLARYGDALPTLKTLISETQPAEKSLYEALFFVQHKLGQYQDASTTLQTLIAIDPQTKVYWRQLAALHYENDNPDHALAVLEAAHQQGVLQDSTDDLLNLVNLYRSQGVPYKAASLLQQLLDQHPLPDPVKLRKQQIELWLSAEEIPRAIQALEQLITQTPTAQHWLRLGQLYIDQRQWSAAARALHKAIHFDTVQAQHLSNQQLAKAWLWLGIVYFENGQTQDSRHAFQRSEHFTQTQQAARQWLRYLETSG